MYHIILRRNIPNNPSFLRNVFFLYITCSSSCVLIFMGVCQFIIEINVYFIYIYIKREREKDKERENEEKGRKERDLTM